MAKVVCWLDVLVHLLTFVHPLVENGLYHAFVTGIKQHFLIYRDDVGYCRSEIARSDYTYGLIR